MAVAVKDPVVVLHAWLNGRRCEPGQQGRLRSGGGGRGAGCPL